MTDSATGDSAGPADAFNEAAHTNSYFRRWYASGGIISADDAFPVALLGENGCDYGARLSMQAHVDAGRAYIRDTYGVLSPLAAPVSADAVSPHGPHADADDDGPASI